ncbi:ABC transporter substrate-binding protein [Cohnella sp. 56]|uniref:ABC transporter substrate-binding protein n=1 Tax=Cohnella sp. 56 TaxID=3113722 RepID=UPI0030E90507
MRPSIPIRAAPLLCLAAWLTGCGTAPAGEAANQGPAALVVHDFAKREVRFAQPPARIVALGNGEADIVYALGGSLVGRPNATGADPLPAAAGDVPQVGSAHEVDLERITLAKPDVVLGNYPLNQKDIPTIEGLGAKLVLAGADSVEDVKREVVLIGELLRREDAAAGLVAQIDEGLANVAARRPAERPRVLLVYGAPGANMAALPNSLSGDLLTLAGGDNIAAKFTSLQSFPQYAQLSAERIVEADPQFIFIMSHGDAEAVKSSFVKDMSRNGAWDGVDAVRHGHVAILPADLFGTNPGTRVIAALELLQHELELTP